MSKTTKIVIEIEGGLVSSVYYFSTRALERIAKAGWNSAPTLLMEH